MLVENKEITVLGKFVKIARLSEEWYEDIEDPLLFLESIKKSKLKADIFTFFQRLPETKPKYSYYMEWDSIAAFQIINFKHWFKKQINENSRRNIKKAKKKGVDIKETDFNDEFVKGLTSIFNETPIRQGKPFWHYGMDFDSVKQVFSRNIHREDIVGAYYNGNLIGFIMLAYGGKYAMLTQILSKLEHRDKSPNNALIAKAVEICDAKKISYLVYAKWPRGSLAEFKRRNGFEKIDLPRYYIPLTIRGKIVLKLRLHNGISGIVPENLMLHFIDLRSKWYSRKLKNVGKG